MRKILASLCLVAVVLSGCANGPSETGAGDADALPVLLDAVQKTSDAGSARARIDLTFTAPEQTLHVTGDVGYVLDPDDPDSLREHVVLHVPSLGMMPGGDVELIVDAGPVVYVKAPMLAAFIPATTPWIKVDPAALPQKDGELGHAAEVFDPAAVLGAIEAALTVEEIGADPVGDADATRYRASVDLVALLPMLADLSDENPSPAEMQEAEDQLRKVGMETLPIDLWVDADGYLTQVRFALDLTDLEPSRPTSFALTVTFSDIGEDIQIDVPPASQVTDVTDLLGGALPSMTTLA